MLQGHGILNTSLRTLRPRLDSNQHRACKTHVVMRDKLFTSPLRLINATQRLNRFRHRLVNWRASSMKEPPFLLPCALVSRLALLATLCHSGIETLEKFSVSRTSYIVDLAVLNFYDPSASIAPKRIQFAQLGFFGRPILLGGRRGNLPPLLGSLRDYLMTPNGHDD